MNGMTLIVKQVTKLVIGFILMFSAYIILYGHLTPGGGFVGGVMLACGFILLVLAFGKTFVNTILSDHALTGWDCVGALGFAAMALAGYYAGAFAANFLARPGTFKLFSAGTILPINLAIGIKVGAAMAAAFIALTTFHPEHEPDLRGTLL